MWISMLWIESASPAHSMKSKLRKTNSLKFSKNSRNFAKWFFLIFLFPLLDMDLRSMFVSGTCPRNTNWAGQNVQQSFQIVRLSLANLTYHFLKLNMKEQYFLVILNKKSLKIRSTQKYKSRNYSFCWNNYCKAIWYLFHGFLCSNCRINVVYPFGNEKIHRNFRMFQKQAKKFKQTSLQGRSLFEIAFALSCVKAGRAFFLAKIVKQKGFRISSSKIHIFGYTDPFLCGFFSL